MSTIQISGFYANLYVICLTHNIYFQIPQTILFIFNMSHNGFIFCVTLYIGYEFYLKLLLKKFQILI